MLAVARNHHRLPPLSRRVAAAAAIPRSSTYGSRAVATSSETDQQEREKKSKSTSTWMKLKLFLPPAVFVCAGSERVYSLHKKSELAQQWESRLKLEVLKGSEIYPLSRESSKSIEFRKVRCRGVFYENKSILVLENKATASDPFAYEYSLVTPFTLLPSTHPPQSDISHVLVNRGRVPRDWADYTKIVKLQSLEIVRDFPQKEKLSSPCQPRARTQPGESLGITRNIMLKLRKHLIPSFPRPRPQPEPEPEPEPEPAELVGIIRSGIYPGWFDMNVGAIVGAVGLDPNATLYVQKIDDASHESTVATPYTEDHLLSRFATMRKEHIEMIVIWYCCSGGAFYFARWLLRLLKKGM